MGFGDKAGDEAGDEARDETGDEAGDRVRDEAGDEGPLPRNIDDVQIPMGHIQDTPAIEEASTDGIGLPHQAKEIRSNSGS